MSPSTLLKPARTLLLSASALFLVAAAPLARAAEIPASLVQVDSSVMAAQSASRVSHVYPQEAKDAHIQGSVILRAVIGKDGSIESLKLVSGPEVLARSAWAAVRDWTYKPFLLNGQPTRVETTITVNYLFGA